MSSNLDWIPQDGVHLTGIDLTEVMSALRAAINGTDADEPNRAHLVHIATIVAHALQRDVNKSD